MGELRVRMSFGRQITSCLHTKMGIFNEATGYNFDEMNNVIASLPGWNQLDAVSFIMKHLKNTFLNKLLSVYI